MSGDPAGYLDLVTSEHRSKPNFIASLKAVVQPFADQLDVLASVAPAFDIDAAVGVQLDAVGLWVGRSRNLRLAITGVYFALDTDGVGFDQGAWKGPFDPSTGLVALPDDSYRVLLKATVAANQWDGTIPSAYAIWDSLFGGSVSPISFEGAGPVTFVGGGPISFTSEPATTGILIQDNGDMTMLFALTGQTPDAITLALLTGGYLALKPAGVHIDAYMAPSIPGPIFGFDVENSAISGFDAGGWGTLYPPT